MSVKVTPKGSTTGLKSVTKLHASTFVDGRIEVDGGKLVKAEVKTFNGGGTCGLKHTFKASLSKFTSLSDNNGIWTTMVYINES